jgi:hypothetical protein
MQMLNKKKSVKIFQARKRMIKNYSFNQLSFVLLLVYDFETFLATFLILLKNFTN